MVLLSKKKLNDSQKALWQISKELNKLTRVIASIGKGLFNVKVEKLRQKKADFEEFSEKNNRKGVT